MIDDVLPPFLHEHSNVQEWRQAAAVLTQDYPSEWHDIPNVLTNRRLLRDVVLIVVSSENRLLASAHRMVYNAGEETSGRHWQRIGSDASRMPGTAGGPRWKDHLYVLR